MVPDAERAWHAGNSAMNARSIGIEHVAALGDKITAAQETTSLALIRWLMSNYNIPISNVIPHVCVKPTSCCGDLFKDYGGGAGLSCDRQKTALHKWLAAHGIPDGGESDTEPQAAFAESAISPLAATASQRLAMAKAIVNFEARRNSAGRLKVYYLPPGDGGGRYEVAGINERYHKQVCDELVELIENGRAAEAEERAIEFIAAYTEKAASWTSNAGIESYLRDAIFNRGQGGAAWILQKAVGVPTDRQVGPVTLAAVAEAERRPRDLLDAMRAARERYERDVVGRNESSQFWNGLVNRWNKAKAVAIGFLDSQPSFAIARSSRTAFAPSAAIGSDLRQAKMELKRLYRSAPEGFRAFAANATDPMTNIVGVGIGEKQTDGGHTGVMSAKLLVRQKVPKESVPQAHMLPASIDGVLVDVEEVGLLRPLPLAAASRMTPFAGLPNPRKRHTPARSGCSIGFEIPGGGPVMAGTFGAVVKKDGKLFILSNCHVLADEGRLEVGSPIFQQGLLDLAGEPRREIAKFAEFAPLQDGGVDAALAEIIDPEMVAFDVLHIGGVSGQTAAQVDLLVHKFGRTTSYTVGRISIVEADVTVPYETGPVAFEDQLLIVGLDGTTFSNSGDFRLANSVPSRQSGRGAAFRRVRVAHRGEPHRQGTRHARRNTDACIAAGENGRNHGKADQAASCPRADGATRRPRGGPEQGSRREPAACHPCRRHRRPNERANQGRRAAGDVGKNGAVQTSLIACFTVACFRYEHHETADHCRRRVPHILHSELLYLFSGPCAPQGPERATPDNGGA